MNRVPDHIAFGFIASVIAMNAFPLDMHSQCCFHQKNRCYTDGRRIVFNPVDVFRAFYWEACLLGLQEFSDSRQLSSDLVCADIETHIISMFSLMKHGAQSASDRA